MTQVLYKYRGLIFVYFVSYILILFNDGVYWDGWCFYNVKPEYIIANGKELGLFLNWPSYLHAFLLHFSFGIILERVIIFFSILVAGIFFYETLKKFNFFEEVDALFLAIFFLIFPHNFSRITISTMYYSISYLLFYVSFYFFISRKNRVLTLILFLLSFTMNSFLFFYVVPVASLFYLEYKFDISKENIFKFIKNYFDFLILPFLFLALKMIFFKNHGYFSDYNGIEIWLIIISPFRFLASFYSIFIQALNNIFYVSLQNLVFLVILTFILFKLIWSQNKFLNSNKTYINKNSTFILIGFILMFIGAFPYIIVRKMPVLDVWEDRFGILMNLGASFIVLFLIKKFVNFYGFKKNIYNLILSLIVSVFCIYNFNMYMDFCRYNFKNKSIIENLKKQENFEIIKNNYTFLIKDKTEKYMVSRRIDHEYVGMMNLLVGGNNRLTLFDIKEMESYVKNKAFISPFYSMQNYILEEKPSYIIEILDNDIRNELNNQRYMLKNILYNLIKKKRFEENTTRLIKINFKKYDGSEHDS